MAEEKRTTVYAAIAAGTLAVIIAVLIWLMRPSPQPQSSVPTLTDEQRAYLDQIVVTDARMSAAENFLGHTVTYLDAVVVNQGTKLVRELELELVFVDTLNQVVLRERTRPVTPRASPLKPGDSRALQVTFEHMPLEWNQAPPAITPKYVAF